MARQNINLGAAPNDGNGDTIRDGGDKINDNFIELYDRNKSTTQSLTANVDYVWANPFTLPVIPKDAVMYASDGTKVLDAYININQSTGDITFNVGANFTNAILKAWW